MTTVFHEFDSTRHAFINPGDSTKEVPDFPSLCVTTFSEGIVQRFIAMNETKQIASLYSANGVIPVYEIVYRNHRIAFYLSRVGAPACAVGLEEIIAMGAKKIILFGSCGILDEAAAGNKIIIPTSAVRDEGTSYHYVAASEELLMKDNIVKAMSECLEQLNIPYILGKTWTSDGIYRETPKMIQKRKQQGCIAVEMECSAALAVTGFRNIAFGQFLFGADSLTSENWEINDLMAHGLHGTEKYMAIALECVLSLKSLLL